MQSVLIFDCHTIQLKKGTSKVKASFEGGGKLHEVNLKVYSLIRATFVVAVRATVNDIFERINEERDPTT